MSKVVGLDLTEQEFDVINQRVTNAIKVDGVECETYAFKTNATMKGFWLPILEAYLKYFSVEEIADAVEYVPIDEEETYEI